MSTATIVEVQRIVRSAAEPRAPGDSVKAAIGRAARALGLSYRRCYDMWYASPSAVIRAHEADRLRAEELRILAAERVRLTVQMAWIEARLEQKENRGIVNAEETGAQNRAHVAADHEDRRTTGREVGEAGIIRDRRQSSLL